MKITDLESIPPFAGVPESDERINDSSWAATLPECLELPKCSEGETDYRFGEFFGFGLGNRLSLICLTSVADRAMVTLPVSLAVLGGRHFASLQG